MAPKKTGVSRFVAHFQSQVKSLEQVESLMLRKLLYATALDPLARAAFGNIGHRTRMVRLIDELTTWDGRELVSLPQLKLALSEAKRGRGRLAREVRCQLGNWQPGLVIPIANSPKQSELLPLATPAEEKLINACLYSNLFYTYRNNLVHEFREPGYGIELSTDGDFAYYTSTINGPWELVFPVRFFSSLFEEVLVELKAYLIRNNIDPYNQFEYGSLWRAR